MAVEIFLKIGDGTSANGIPGDSTDNVHKGEISIIAYYWGETVNGGRAAGAAAGPGGGAGKVALQDFRFSAYVGLASQGLFSACATGKHFSTAVLNVRKAGTTTDFLRVTLADVFVSSFQMGNNLLDAGTYSPLVGAASAPIDQFSLNFGKINFQYAAQGVTGAGGQLGTGGVTVGG